MSDARPNLCALAESESQDTSGRPAIRRYQLQVFAPDWGGWHTVVTAADEPTLATPSRLLGWQTGKKLRIVDPDGRVVREIDPAPPSLATEAAIS